jgi:hypothetical protein
MWQTELLSPVWPEKEQQGKENKGEKDEQK